MHYYYIRWQENPHWLRPILYLNNGILFHWGIIDWTEIFHSHIPKTIIVTNRFMTTNTDNAVVNKAVVLYITHDKRIKRCGDFSLIDGLDVVQKFHGQFGLRTWRHSTTFFGHLKNEVYQEPADTWRHYGSNYWNIQRCNSGNAWTCVTRSH